MYILEAILLGIIQALTEFFPVSSTAHLLFFQRLMKTDSNNALLFDLVLHSGTAAVICLLLRKDFRRIFYSLKGMASDSLFNLRLAIRERKSPMEKQYRKLLSDDYRKLSMLWLVAIVPAVLIGSLLRGLFLIVAPSFLMTGILFFITALMLLVADLMPPQTGRGRMMKARDAALTGIFQGFSVLPGLSGLATCMASCILAGQSRKFSVRFALLLSVPVTFGGLLGELFMLREFSLPLLAACIMGAVASAFFGLLLIRRVLSLVRTWKLRGFALYSFLVGVLLIVLNFTWQL